MALPHELEYLQQIQKVSEPRSNEFRIARLPEAQPLPLISQNVGMSRWQLSNKATSFVDARKGARCRSWPLASLNAAQRYVWSSVKSGSGSNALKTSKMTRSRRYRRL